MRLLPNQLKSEARAHLAVFGENNKGKLTSEKKLGALFPFVFTPRVGHMMMRDNPDVFYEVVAEFINQL